MKQEPDRAVVSAVPVDGAPAPTPDVPPRPKRRFPDRLRPLAGIVVLLALFVSWEILTSFVAYTDDAYVRSDLVAIAPQVTGAIVTVAVTDNQDVHRGDLLVRIDPTPFRLDADAAEAVLREAKAQAQADQDSVSGAEDALKAATAALTRAQETQRRALVLAHEGVASGETLDAAIAAYEGAAANVAAGHSAVGRAQTLLAVQLAAILQATAELDSAQWRLGQTTIRAPVDGTVSNFTLHVGDMGYLDKPLIGIVAAHAWRIIANYKQSYLGQLRPNGTAWVWLDTHPWRFYRARIRGIARGISRQQGDTGLLPYVTPTTDWIRLQHRFPVTLVLVNPPADLTYYMGADASCVVFP
jgi:membrane fusion protein, multidrug efflux system